MDSIIGIFLILMLGIIFGSFNTWFWLRGIDRLVDRQIKKRKERKH